MRARSFFASAAAAAITVAVAAPAAAVPCEALKKLGPDGVTPTGEAVPPRVYIAGASPLKTLFSTIAPALFTDPDPNRQVTIVYRVTPSCTAVDQILNGRAMATDDVTEAIYWDPNSKTTASGTTTAKEEKCTLASGQFATIGNSDVFAQTCGLALQGVPPPFADFLGPVMPAVFAVHQGSKEQAISAQAAYMVFGHAKLPPWNDPAFLFRRNATSGTQLLLGAAIGVDAARWAGVDSGSSDKVFASLDTLATQAERDKAIGIVLADFATRGNLRALAYQHSGQRCAYKPDVQGRDKRNVREGRYAIWGNLHIFTKVDASGLAEDQRARDLIAFILGTQAGPGNIDLLRTEAQINVVPPCAMKVKRVSEMGPMSSFKHPRPCGCAFDKEATGTTACKACANNNECGPTESCNFGFCEAQ